MKDFHELRVWQQAHDLTVAIYSASAAFPRDERFGLTSQIRRACASIPANLAEGCGRNGDAELARFCSIALGSASELEYHLLLARDLKFLANDSYEILAGQTIQIKRMLGSLISKLTASTLRTRKLKAES
jgi:four helix bundle protein